MFLGFKSTFFHFAHITPSTGFWALSTAETQKMYTVELYQNTSSLDTELTEKLDGFCHDLVPVNKIIS